MPDVISLSEKPQIDALLQGDPSPFSEYCFANLYLFRHRHAYRLNLHPMPHLTGITYDGVPHALPLGQSDQGSLMALAQRVGCVYPLPADTAALFDTGTATAYNDADSDYLYAGERLATLSGAKAKRAQARIFAQHHAPWYRPLAASDLALAVDVLAGWLGDVGRPADATDHAECLEALALFQPLALEGALIGIGTGEAVAFLLASRRPDGTRIVHFAKGRRAYAGAYPWMFAQYAEATGAPFLNFEQDLGNPAFAQAKRALAPVTRLHKFRLGRA